MRSPKARSSFSVTSSTSMDYVNHRREFRVRVQRYDGREELIPIWIPSSIMATGAAEASGEGDIVANLAAVAVMNHGKAVADLFRQTQVKVDSMGQVAMAAKKASFTVQRAGGRERSALSAEEAILGWGGFLISYIYGSKTVFLNDTTSTSNVGSTSYDKDSHSNVHRLGKRMDGDERHDPLWQASLDTFNHVRHEEIDENDRESVSRSRDQDSLMYHSNLTIPSSCSEPIVDYYNSNVGCIPPRIKEIWLEADGSEDESFQPRQSRRHKKKNQFQSSNLKSHSSSRSSIGNTTIAEGSTYLSQLSGEGTGGRRESVFGRIKSSLPGRSSSNAKI